MTPQLVFGYGSLINPSSLARTTKRKMNTEDLSLAHLSGWRRSWSYVIDCAFDQDHGRPSSTLFLNIEHDPKTELPGILFEVSEEELKRIDKREYGYDRIDVSHAITPKPMGQVYTYVASPGFGSPQDRSVIPASYYETVKEGAQFWGAEFEEEFWSTTSPHSFGYKEGRYGPYYRKE